MKIGDLVLDKTINQMGIVTDVGYGYSDEEEYIVVELCDGSEIFAIEQDLELVVASKIV